MCECHCHDNYNLDTLVPMVGVLTDIRQETPDVKTFRALRTDREDARRAFRLQERLL